MCVWSATPSSWSRNTSTAGDEVRPPNRISTYSDEPSPHLVRIILITFPSLLLATRGCPRAGEWSPGQEEKD